jgi:hypothetical protein
MTSPEISMSSGFKHRPDVEVATNMYEKSFDTAYDTDTQVLKWWDSFAKGIIGISTIGASICFSVIFSDLPDPVASRSLRPSKLSSKIHFDKEAVRTLLSASWLLFVLALGFALVSQLKLRKSREWGAGLKGLELLLNGLVLGAFMCLSLAVAAFVPKVGIAGVGFISFFAFMVICMWLGAI